MDTREHEKKKFIKSVRESVRELLMKVINTNSKTKQGKASLKLLENQTTFCMNCLWKTVWVNRGWAGNVEEWMEKGMEVNMAIKVIRDNILPKLQATADLNDTIDTSLVSAINDLVLVVKTGVETFSEEDTVNELNALEKTNEYDVELPDINTRVHNEDDVELHPTPDINTRVQDLEEQVRKLRLLVEDLIFKHPPDFVRQALLKQLARHT
jgi:hypothetical protein